MLNHLRVLLALSIIASPQLIRAQETSDIEKFAMAFIEA